MHNLNITWTQPEKAPWTFTATIDMGAGENVTATIEKSNPSTWTSTVEHVLDGVTCSKNISDYNNVPECSFEVNAWSIQLLVSSELIQTALDECCISR